MLALWQLIAAAALLLAAAEPVLAQAPGTEPQPG